MRRSKVVVALAVLGEEIEEVPLRHERDEFAVRRQMAEIGHLTSSAPIWPVSVSTF